MVKARNLVCSTGKFQKLVMNYQFSGLAACGCPQNEGEGLMKDERSGKCDMLSTMGLIT
jgi:hypothetical protein